MEQKKYLDGVWTIKKEQKPSINNYNRTAQITYTVYGQITGEI